MFLSFLSVSHNLSIFPSWILFYVCTLPCLEFLQYSPLWSISKDFWWKQTSANPPENTALIIYSSIHCDSLVWQDSCLLLFMNAVLFLNEIWSLWGEGVRNVIVLTNCDEELWQTLLVLLLTQSCIEYVLMKIVSMLTGHCIWSLLESEFIACSIVVRQLGGCRQEAQRALNWQQEHTWLQGRVNLWHTCCDPMQSHLRQRRYENTV